MDYSQEGFFERIKWHIAIIALVVFAVCMVALMTDIIPSGEQGQTPLWIWLLVILMFLLLGILILSKILKTIETIQGNSVRLEKIAEALEKNRAVLSNISNNTRLSEAAKTIASRDINRQALSEAVFDKLQQNDFDTMYEIIDEVSHMAEFKDLAQQLRQQAEIYRTASDQEKMKQIIAHIEKLLESCEWAKASVHIERLIKAYPDAEEAKALRATLLKKKEEQKKKLLTLWDDAVKREATDRSLEILRELDQYLTPNEGLALQEAARDVFRNKLHNLGVRFSLAISGKQWKDAVSIGQQIMKSFPNSRMAQEIREKIDVLRQKAS
ncbi:hypothetical protein ACFL1G_04990 [Planctomycetota bacterium]